MSDVVQKDLLLPMLIILVLIIASVALYYYVTRIKYKSEIHTSKVESIPVLWIEPENMNKNTPMVIWLDGFTGSKERTVRKLHTLAKKGYLAISFDVYDHGERSIKGEDIQERVFANFRSEMWPIIGGSSEDAIKVLDWSEKKFDISNKICMGGFSMGGDIAVVVAGMDKRINCVAAVVSTPDWLRPGMKETSFAHNIIPQGEANKKAQAYYDRLNPLTHVSNYGHEPAITFELGAKDVHIPATGALSFQQKLKRLYDDPSKIRIVEHSGVGHKFRKDMWQNCLDWFDKYNG